MHAWNLTQLLQIVRMLNLCFGALYDKNIHGVIANNIPFLLSFRIL